MVNRTVDDDNKTEISAASARLSRLRVLWDSDPSNPLLTRECVALALQLISTLHHQGRMDEAVAIADSNSSLIAADTRLSGACALLYLDAGKAEEAEKWSAAALAQDPESLDGLIVKATLHAARMENEPARVIYEQVLCLDKNNARAFLGLGTLAMAAQDFTQARSQLQRATELMPKHVGTWNALGWLHWATGALDEAERTFRHALTLDRNFAETHGALATLSAMRGDRAAAEQDIAVALRLDRQSLAARFAQSVLAGKTGDSAAAKKILQKTLTRLSPRDSGPLAHLLETLNRKI